MPIPTTAFQKSGNGNFSYLVIFKDSKLHLLSLMLVLLRGGVRLLLSLLCTTTKSQHKMKGRFLFLVSKKKIGAYNFDNVVVTGSVGQT